MPYDALVAEVGSIASLCAALGELDLPDFVEPPDCTRGLPFTLRLRVEDGSGDVELAVKQVLFRPSKRRSAMPRTEPGAFRAAALPGRRRGRCGPSVDGAQRGRGADLTPRSHPTRSSSGTREHRRGRALRLARRRRRGRGGRSASALCSPGTPPAEGWSARTPTLRRTSRPARVRDNALNLDRNTAAEEGDEIGLYVVLRDARGGVDFLERRLVVEFIEAAP